MMRDFLAELISEDVVSKGYIKVTSIGGMNAPQVSARTYNDTELGTFGQNLQTYGAEDLLVAGATRYIPGGANGRRHRRADPDILTRARAVRSVRPLPELRAARPEPPRHGAGAGDLGRPGGGLLLRGGQQHPGSGADSDPAGLLTGPQVETTMHGGASPGVVLPFSLLDTVAVTEFTDESSLQRAAGSVPSPSPLSLPLPDSGGCWSPWRSLGSRGEAPVWARAR